MKIKKKKMRLNINLMVNFFNDKKIIYFYIKYNMDYLIKFFQIPLYKVLGDLL